jgi:hypothetical protein
MDVAEGGQGYQLREAAADYKALFEDDNEDIGLENVYAWDLNADEKSRAADWRHYPKSHSLLTICILDSTFGAPIGGTSNVKDSKDCGCSGRRKTATPPNSESIYEYEP